MFGELLASTPSNQQGRAGMEGQQQNVMGMTGPVGMGGFAGGNSMSPMYHPQMQMGMGQQQQGMNMGMGQPQQGMMFNPMMGGQPQGNMGMMGGSMGMMGVNAGMGGQQGIMGGQHQQGGGMMQSQMSNMMGMQGQMNMMGGSQSQTPQLNTMNGNNMGW